MPSECNLGKQQMQFYLLKCKRYLPTTSIWLIGPWNRFSVSST